MAEASKYEPVWLGMTAVAAVLAIVGVVVWPFVFEPIAGLFLLIASKSTPSRRFTMPVAMLITVCALAGASIAVGYSRALY